ncbi:MAG: hypothetical protein JWO38_42 [Gemmataceae bacterium]|nr:hypothetical protein [Gemmataceae bacterium]
MSIQDQPHYELPSTELAMWVERRGPNQWWMVDGDRYLGGRVPGPCRADELAAVLRRVNRVLLVADRQNRPDATGQPITADQIDSVVYRLADIMGLAPGQPEPPWANDLCLRLCWKGEPDEWLLMEDSVATEAFRDVIIEPIGAR